MAEMAPSNAGGRRASIAQCHKGTPAERVTAAESIRKPATQVKGESRIKELIAGKHASHKY